jgi:hypothetical protein
VEVLMIPEHTLEALVDKQAITEVIYRYCRGMDRLDLDLLLSVYHADSHDDHGGRHGTGHEFARRVVEGLGSVDQRTQHHITNILIELDGDTAWAESYLIAYHRFLEGTQTLLEFGGRYVDRFERRDGEWRMADRVIVYDWSRITPVDEEYPGTHMKTATSPALFEQGRRDRTDIAYRRG